MNKTANTMRNILSLHDALQIFEESLENRRVQFAELVIKEDEPAAKGDTVVIDYEGSVDGEVFEGGTATNYSLELGSDSFIPGFEEHVIGAETDSEVAVTVTFPDAYHAEDLAGKDAVFNVTVHEIKTKELPELDDEFAKDVEDDVETIDELRENIREELETTRKQYADEAHDEEAIRKAVENAEIPEIPH